MQNIESHLNGLLLVDKETGISSYDVIRRIKRVLPRKYKIGHTGTLDPFASGLLILLLGKATKMWESMQKGAKRYTVVAEFGYETTTQDPEGEVTKECNVDTPIDREDIDKSIEYFVGEILQIPPAYSAKKVNGQRAYKLARQGKEVKLDPKKVFVHDFLITDYNWPKVTFDVSVSSGTYIRTLVIDLARELGSCATAVELRRTHIGEYDVKDSIKSDSIDDSFDSATYLIDIPK